MRHQSMIRDTIILSTVLLEAGDTFTFTKGKSCESELAVRFALESSIQCTLASPFPVPCGRLLLLTCETL